MRDQTACFTGHRTIMPQDKQRVIERLDSTIAGLVAEGVIYYGSGAALGFDQEAARAVLRARERNPAVKLIMVLPCADQDSRWNEREKQEYRRLLEAANKVVYVSKLPYRDGCMAARNQYLVDNSGVCIAYMTHGRSGTAQTVRMAKEQSLRVINLAE